MKIYLDAIWFLNFSFDLLLLLLTAIILKRPVKKLRLFLGALAGSSIIILLFTPLGPAAAGPAGKVAISVLMVLITFGFIRFRFFFQNLLMLYFSAFMLGGGIMGAHYFLQTDAAYKDGVIMTVAGGMGDPVSWVFAAAGFPAVWFFSKKRLDEAEAKKIQYEEIVDVRIVIEDFEWSAKGLVDSGNQLTDPITKTPVMILDAKKAAPSLPEGLADLVFGENLLENICSEDHPWLSRMRVIPYRGVGQSHQFLIGIKPDQIIITSAGETVQVKKALIGLSTSSLSTDGDFDCIVHPLMLKSSGALNVS
ncbi:sigma-E processing peptidase SpoIIGA [Metabacillus sp. GX 13764]|uniref:sigma-E processing peptidase SpoIIGA n=1 Tax=Metabacillus kandeliae TaxID=2900151 RepID=UPI001E43DF2D|nr:sigma-E processing peptidase SpoIIGA [Metabacillus kandeliae]MCD7033881.1 sigma-E processing peptidase SpoIIGA [Metabacillus kandeliae]